MVIGFLLTCLDSCTCHCSRLDDQKLGDSKLVWVFEQYSSGIIWKGSRRGHLECESMVMYCDTCQ